MARRPTVAGTAADPTIEFAKLKVDGKEYRLVYDFNAIAEAEDICGCNLLQGMFRMGGEWSAKQIRGLLYAALRIAQPEITLEQVGDLVRLDTLVSIPTALIEAYNLSMPEAKRLKLEENPPEGGGTENPPETNS